MAHFALVNQDNYVTEVCKVSNDVMLDNEGNEIEELGIKFLNEVTPAPQGFRWIQTSYNSNFRGNYAAIGIRYDEELDMFLYEKPYESWVLVDGKWEPHIERPEPNLELGYAHHYDWDETEVNWKLVRDPEVKPLETPDEGYYWVLPEGEYDWVQEELPPTPPYPAQPGFEYVFDYFNNYWIESEIVVEPVLESADPSDEPVGISSSTDTGV